MAGNKMEKQDKGGSSWLVENNSNVSDALALRIHREGRSESESELSDFTKSEFDEEYYIHKPPPLTLDPSQIVTVSKENKKVSLPPEDGSSDENCCCNVLINIFCCWWWC